MNWLWLILAVPLGIFALVRVSFVSGGKARRLLRQGARVIDVRNPGEFDSGHLPNALNIPLGELKEAMPARVPDKNQVLLLHCLSGGRSGLAKRLLRGMGYRQVFNLGSYRRAENLVREGHQE